MKGNQVRGNFMHILEISQDEKSKVTGRRYIKLVLHEVFPSPDQYQKNGISWNEQYTLSNIESAKGMPLCVEFVDHERSEPWGHGLSGQQDNQPLFEYSTMVGIIENAYIGDVEVNGKTIRALIGEGYISEQRYPKFVQWMKSQAYDNKPIESSIEIGAKHGRESIVYEGGWKEKGRVPQIYDYTGHAILGIEPADDSAILLELNNFRHKKEDNRMEGNEKVILELNSKLEQKTVEINSLQDQVKAKDIEINSLSEKSKEKDVEINTLSETNKQLEASVGEKDTLIGEKDAEINSLKAKVKEFEDAALVGELNSKLVDFTDEEKEVVKSEIESFSKNPSKEGIEKIVNEINNAIAKKVLEARKSQSSEQNSHKPADIDGDIYDINTEINQSGTEDSIY